MSECFVGILVSEGPGSGLVELDKDLRWIQTHSDWLHSPALMMILSHKAEMVG